MEILVIIILVLIGIIIAFALYHQNYIVIHEKKRRLMEARLIKLQKKNDILRNELYKEQGITHLIQKHMKESIMILDDSDKIMLANDSAAKLLQINMSLTDQHSIFTLTDVKPFLDALRNAKKEGFTKVLISLDEQDYRTYIRRVSLPDRNGTIILMINVTDSVKAERIRREFTANVSHELKTPMTVIKGFGEMFGSGMIQDKESIEKYGAVIQRESERLLFLMNDIIRLSEIEEYSEPQLELVSLKEIALAAAEIIAEKAKENNISIITELEDVYVQGNMGYLQELFLNLADNAVKYNNPDGWVLITVRSENGNAVINISDNGIGIPKSAQSRIFERFYRVDKSRSKERGGTGLGLSIVKHIVEYHKGSIKLDSCPGKGTSIIVTLNKA